MVSIHDEPYYSTARSCAQNCVWYNGVYNAWDDLASGLGCGARTAVNGCYCKAELASSASSFLTACVSSRCETSDFEITEALSMYNGYCATVTLGHAAVATAIGTASTAPNAFDSSTPTVTGSGINAVGSLSTVITSGADLSDGQLSRSDTIALAIGLGVGLPSLLLGIATFVVQVRRKSRARALRRSQEFTHSKVVRH